jgi:hypothetical protein
MSAFHEISFSFIIPEMVGFRAGNQHAYACNKE